MAKKPDSQAIADHAPWKPVPYSQAEAAAIQALQTGSASPQQQKVAINYVVRQLCKTYDLSYRPGEDGRRDTDFAEGRRAVGLQLVLMLNVKIGTLV